MDARYLDEIEEHCLGLPHVATAVCQGTLDPAALEDAFRLLSRRHPVMLGCIRTVRGRSLLSVPTGSDAKFLRLAHDSIEEYVLESYAKWDPAQSVVQLALLSAGGQYAVALQVDHAVADGRTRTAWFNELWQLYTARSNGSEISLDPERVLPASPVDVLTRYAGATADDSIEHRSSSEPIAPTADPVWERVHLTAAQTADVITVAKAHQTSVHALICGAILIAQRTLGTSSAEPAPMKCWSIVDLRNRFGAATAPTGTTALLGLHAADVTVARDDTPLAVGSKVKQELQDAIAQRRVPVAIIGQPAQLDTPVEQRFANASVSNIGVMPDFTLPGALEITDVRLLTAIPGFVPHYSAYTYAGRLSIQFLYPSGIYTPADAEQVASHVEHQLTTNIS